MKARLPKQCRVRITDERDDWHSCWQTAESDAAAEVGARRAHFWQGRSGYVEQSQQIFSPIKLVNVEQLSTGSVCDITGMDLSTCYIPEDPAIHCSQAHF